MWGLGGWVRDGEVGGEARTLKFVTCENSRVSYVFLNVLASFQCLVQYETVYVINNAWALTLFLQ